MHGQQNIQLYRDARSTEHTIISRCTINRTYNYNEMYGQQNIQLYLDARSTEHTIISRCTVNRTYNYTQMHGQQNIQLYRDARSTEHTIIPRCTVKRTYIYIQTHGQQNIKFYKLTFIFLISFLILTSHPRLDLPICLLLSGVPIKTLFEACFSHQASPCVLHFTNSVHNIST
jgi:hypothetical protein